MSADFHKVWQGNPVYIFTTIMVWIPESPGDPDIFGKTSGSLTGRSLDHLGLVATVILHNVSWSYAHKEVLAKVTAWSNSREAVETLVST